MSYSITKKLLLVSSLALITFIGVGTALSAQDSEDELYKKFDIFVEVLNKVRSEYVEEVEPAEIFDGAMKGMASMLDAESSYLTASEYASFKSENSSRDAQIGVKFIKHPGNRYTYVTYVIPGSPADKSGLAKGDFIRAIDGKSTTSMPSLLMDFYLRGESESIAKLSVIRSGVQGLLDFEIERQLIPAMNVNSVIRESVGIISLHSFDGYVLEEFSSAVDEVLGSGVATLIIDVRNNNSDNIEEAVHCAELFIAGGDILTIKSKGEPVTYTANEPAKDARLFVLINDSTARSAEAFALILKEHAGAELIGEKTLGIATLQREVILDDGAYLNISYGTFESVQGTVVQNEGVTPDIEVDETENGESTADTILDRALERAKETQDQRQAA